MNRNWIGIDASTQAIKSTQEKISSIEADLFINEAMYDFIDLEVSQKRLSK